MGKWRSKLYKTDRARDFDHERDRQVRARQVYETIDRQPFQWIVVLVAGMGFFLDGYTLFASNIALPMIAYVYWNDEVSHDKLTAINTATLAGTVIGQVMFGVLADQKGRKKMYGMELVVLVLSTLGVVMASTGSHNSMSIFAWLIFWRFTAGIGVGADYPLSAVITSEFAPTVHRARMMASVFFMQPLGQVSSTLASMIVISVTRRSLGDADPIRVVDTMWRWVIGIAVIPGLLAILFRFAIPESPRFMLEIEDDPIKAEFDATYLFGETDDQDDLVSPTSSELETGLWTLDTKVPIHRPAASISSNFSTSNTFCYNSGENDCSPTSALASADWTLASTTVPTLNSKWSITRQDLHQFFITEKNYRTLLATSVAWLLLDFGFYGIALSSPHFLAKTWGNLDIAAPRPPWQITDDPSVDIYDTFFQTSLHALVILNIGSVFGSALLILTINRLNRVTLQRYGFLFLAAIFVTMGVTFLTTSHRQGPVAVILYVVAQVAFNFGPNATTFMLPAELFPTRYRATCHGIAAATGKSGSLLSQVISSVAAHYDQGNQINGSPPSLPGSGLPLIGQPMPNVDVDGERSDVYAKILIGFSVAMVLGFVVSLWVPMVQEKVVEGRNGGKKTATAEDGDNDGMVERVKRQSIAVASGLGAKGLRSKTLEELSIGSARRLGRRGWSS